MLSILFLLLAIPLFLVSLLAVVPAPLNVLWKISIVVLEGGYFLTLPCLLLAFLSFGGGLWGKVGALLFFAAGLLLGLPLARAMGTAARLEKDLPAFLMKAQGADPRSHSLRAHPLIWRDLVLGMRLSPVKPETRVYAQKSGESLALDFYAAAQWDVGRGVGKGAPCVLVVHGGGWDSGNRGNLPALNNWLASRGYAVASLDYRLAPEHLYPAPIEDVGDALEYLKQNAAGLGIDPSRFVLLGRSAGGQIALQAAYTLQDPAIRGVIGFYAPADMVFGYSLPGNPLVLDSRLVMDRYLGGSCFQHPEKCRESSPLEFADAQSPPTLLLHGTADVMVSPLHTRHLEDKLERLGVPHFTVDLPWATHGYDYVFSGPGSQIGLYFIGKFLAAVTP